MSKRILGLALFAALFLSGATCRSRNFMEPEKKEASINQDRDRRLAPPTQTRPVVIPETSDYKIITPNFPVITR